MYLAHKEEAWIVIPRSIPLLCYKYRPEIEKCFPLDAVDQICHDTYDNKTGEISSLMDAHISKVDEGDKELHLEMEEEKVNLAPDKDKKQGTTWTYPKIL